jgi:hypothetical protein
MPLGAARTQAVNPQLANRQWARVDRAMVDAAPWVPLFNPRCVELLSRRAGGHRYSPIYATLIDQLWVRQALTPPSDLDRRDRLHQGVQSTALESTRRLHDKNSHG